MLPAPGPRPSLAGRGGNGSAANRGRPDRETAAGGLTGWPVFITKSASSVTVPGGWHRCWAR